MSYQSEERVSEESNPTSTPSGYEEKLPTPPSPAGYDEKRAKKKLHVAFFIILLSLAGVAAFSAFLNFCMSMSQVTTSTVLADGTSIWKNGNYSCADVKTFLPLRWQFVSQKDLMMVCPWPASNSGFRSFMSIVALADIALFVFALKKSENTIINWSFIGSCGVIALMYLIIAIVDGTALSKGNGFCDDGMPQAIDLFKPELLSGNHSIECFGDVYTGTMFSNIFVLVAFPGLAVYFIFYQRRTHQVGETTIPQEDETKPLAKAEVRPKMFTASEINDESLTQDVTGANPFDPRTGMVDPSSIQA